MSGGNSVDIVDDEDFFDRPLNRQGAAEKAAAEQRSSPCTDVAGHSNASSFRHRGGLRRSSNDDSSSDHSSDGKRKKRGRSASNTKSAVVIQLPPETESHQVEEHSDHSTTSEGRSTEREDSFREHPPRYKKNKKVTNKDKKTKAAESHGKKMSSYSRCDYSSDEEKRQWEARLSRLSASSASTSHRDQRLGKYKNSRSTSAPVRRPHQFIPVRGSGNKSRMDVKALLESILEVENPRQRRKFVAKPVEFRWRRNYTFSDQRLEMIERENKRLLGRLIRIHFKKPTYDQKPPASVKPTTLPDITRMKHLEKIQKENLV